MFVYRGKEYERLTDFCNRTLNQLPNAELMNKLTPPGEDIMESMQQCILCPVIFQLGTYRFYGYQFDYSFIYFFVLTWLTICFSVCGFGSKYSSVVP